ncbi:MAG: anhydro-N-acetylmuramic acid kinase [Bauldia sp.]|uniref:anhydro-N-acetylmuramic acid kinase n=1 Tax=Bauldia sp. TaxID=2575872 RepID=UPI001DAE60A1|nr:anhydro-N-acetylmuramic acid kinase [Bauldia sp.]MCB1496157.1 anhydro-N-acetylmuramic acid kinase [Bauldia sp.]
MQTVAGMMSGTSMDGVDVAVLVTDGESVESFGPTFFRPYDQSERTILRQALAEARELTDRTARPGILAEAERVVTDAHGDAIETLRAANPGLTVDLVGFHGQTVIHAPDRLFTVQIGDGPALARRLGTPVVYDFRAADVAAGGEGAPFVPLYHRALVRMAGLTGDIVVANIGGVGNITRIGADGGIAAGDTGPGNAMIDDLVAKRTGAAMDEGGRLAARGAVDKLALTALMADPWFGEPLPKSLDRNAFSPAPVQLLRTEDGAATLAAFTASSMAGAIVDAGGADLIVVSGGGAHNPVILGMLAEMSGAEVKRADDLGWRGDFIEAEAFAYLAARSRAGLPLSLPETTGVAAPMTGGVLARPD